MPSIRATARDIRKLCECLWVEEGRVYRNTMGYFIRKGRGSTSFRVDAAAKAAIGEGSAFLASDDTLRLTPDGRERYPQPTW